MKIAIIGSRGLPDGFILPRLNFLLDEKHKGKVEVITGGARGVDYWVERYCDSWNIPCKVMRAKWNDLNSKPCFIKYKNGKPYNALAGFNRNKKVVDCSDKIVAIWDGKSPGTKDVIDYAKARHKNVEVIQK